LKIYTILANILQKCWLVFETVSSGQNYCFTVKWRKVLTSPILKLQRLSVFMKKQSTRYFDSQSYLGNIKPSFTSNVQKGISNI